MRLDCQQCSDLRQIALAASKAYHQRLEDLEAAHICRNSEVLAHLSTRLETAFRSRNTAIAQLTNHESACVSEKPAEALSLIKRKSA